MGKRWLKLALLAAVLVPQARAAALPPTGCAQATTFQYCGEHWRAAKLPVAFRVNLAGAPGALNASDVTAALSGAAQAWNLSWPRTGGADVGPNAAVRAAGTTALGFGRDGQNTIVFGDPAWCGGSADALAIACTWYESPGSKRIAEV